MAATKQITVGTKIVDRDGFAGTVVAVTEWRGSRWYSVRFAGGVAVRYDADIAQAA